MGFFYSSARTGYDERWAYKCYSNFQLCHHLVLFWHHIPATIVQYHDDLYMIVAGMVSIPRLVHVRPTIAQQSHDL